MNANPDPEEDAAVDAMLESVPVIVRSEAKIKPLRAGLSVREKQRRKDLFAQKMRDEPTRGEVDMLEILVRLGISMHFARQVVLAGYIVDFYSAAARLIIEVDGPSHRTAKAVAADAYRDRVLSRLGARVIRFTNQECAQSKGKVGARVAQIFGHRYVPQEAE